MKKWFKAGVLVLAAAVLSGCGSFIRSNVTSFHEWPAQLPQQTYVFERNKEQDASLEYRRYENLVRAELNRLGLMEAGPNVAPYLKVNFQTSIAVRDVREIYPVVVQHPYYVPGFVGGMYAHPGYAYGPLYNPYYGPFYDPFWYGPPMVQQREANYQLFTRELKLSIARFADGKPLFQSTVVSEGEKGSLAAAMPYLVRSMFKDFPGPNGVTRQVELKVE